MKTIYFLLLSVLIFLVFVACGPSGAKVAKQIGTQGTKTVKNIKPGTSKKIGTGVTGSNVLLKGGDDAYRTYQEYSDDED